MLQKKETITVVVPVYNEEECLDELLSRLLAVREKVREADFSFIFVNDGSGDSTAQKLDAHAQQHDFVKVIHFSRNFGHQPAVSAGLDHADADYAVIIDADLQDPPELIADMYKMAKEGYDIIYGKRSARAGETLFKKATAKIFYRFLSRMCDTDIPPDTGDFRLISRRVLNTVRGMRERHRFLRGMVPWVGFNSAPLYYQRDRRYAGETKYPLRKMIKFALDAIFSFSITPLRLATYSGLWLVFLGMLGALLIIYLRFFTKYSVPGISAVIVTLIIIGGFQIIMLGIIGEYIGRIFEESKGRPLYVVKETRNIGELPGETGRSGA